jgi:hypothetical protein
MDLRTLLDAAIRFDGEAKLLRLEQRLIIFQVVQPEFSGAAPASVGEIKELGSSQKPLQSIYFFNHGPMKRNRTLEGTRLPGPQILNPVFTKVVRFPIAAKYSFR